MKFNFVGGLLLMVFGLHLATSLSPLNLAFASDPEAKPIEVYRFDIDATAPNPDGIAKISVNAAEVSDPEDSEAALQLVTPEGSTKEFAEITTVIPDHASAVTPEFYQATQSLSQSLNARVREKVKISSRAFPEWFSSNKFRLSIIAVEFTLTSGLKYGEMILSPQPIAHVPAIAAAMTIGTVLGAVEWNTPKIMGFIKTTGTPVKRLFTRIAENSESPERRAKIEGFLEKTWQFGKNTAINFGLFNIFKLVVYSTTQAHGNEFQRVTEAFQATSMADLGSALKLSLLATAVSFPTTQVILAYRDKWMKEAGTDPAKLLRMRDHLTLAVSTALMARALMFSSKIVAGTIHWPSLNYAANAGLTVMFAGSVAKLYYDSRKAKLGKCNELLEAKSE